MRVFRLVASGAALLIVGGCADDRNILDPTAPALSVQGRSSELAAASARQIQTLGHFDALVDFSTLTLTPRGRNCLLRVNGQLVFTGTIQGAATGQTSALVFAPCADVAANPPGTFPDVFKSELTFVGTVDGQPARANVLYMGRVQPGGQIEGRLLFSRGVQGRLEVDAVVAVGGDYSGSVVVR
jgi:hypothetical protein